jgi:hypothetical protein
VQSLPQCFTSLAWNISLLEDDVIELVLFGHLFQTKLGSGPAARGAALAPWEGAAQRPSAHSAADGAIAAHAHEPRNSASPEPESLVLAGLSKRTGNSSDERAAQCRARDQQPLVARKLSSSSSNPSTDVNTPLPRKESVRSSSGLLPAGGSLGVFPLALSNSPLSATPATPLNAVLCNMRGPFWCIIPEKSFGPVP